MRDLTAAVLTELGKSELQPVLFAELDFTSGFVRLWNGYGDLTWSQGTFTGGGSLVSVAPMPETASIKSAGYSLSMSGIPSTLLAIALGECYQGRSAKLWLGFLTPGGALIADPVLMISARMDTMNIDEGAETSTISLTIENQLTDPRPRISRYTDQEQQRRYPGDTGLSRTAKIVDQTLFWGNAR